MKEIKFFNGTTINSSYLFFILGPCQIESAEHSVFLAGEINEIMKRCEIPWIFMAPFDKSDRSSLTAVRGAGLHSGVDVLSGIREKFGIPVMTDIHEPWQAELVAPHVDMIEIPDVYAKFNNLIAAAAKTGKPLNLKKATNMSPMDMTAYINKVLSCGNDQIMLCERGSSIIGHDLIVDYRNFKVMAESGYPVAFDATHCSQSVSGLSLPCSGKWEVSLDLAKAAVATGVSVISLEVHDNPSKAFSDGPIATPLKELEVVIRKLKQIYDAGK